MIFLNNIADFSCTMVMNGFDSSTNLLFQKSAYFLHL